MFYTLNLMNTEWKYKKRKRKLNINTSHTQLHTDKTQTPVHFSQLTWKKKIIIEVVSGDTNLILTWFIFAPFHIERLQLVIRFSDHCLDRKTVLILELRTLIEGEDLFCLEEYRSCFAINKICFRNISSSHLIMPNIIYLSERFSFLTLWSLSHFISST